MFSTDGHVHCTPNVQINAYCVCYSSPIFPDLLFGALWQPQTSAHTKNWEPSRTGTDTNFRFDAAVDRAQYLQIHRWTQGMRANLRVFVAWSDFNWVGLFDLELVVGSSANECWILTHPGILSHIVQFRQDHCNGKCPNAHSVGEVFRSQCERWNASNYVDQVKRRTHFFQMKNISFCGHHPRNEKYFGFITRHPTQYRFACHTFVCSSSTRDVIDSFGTAFSQYFQDYMEFVQPSGDIYLEWDLRGISIMPGSNFDITSGDLFCGAVLHIYVPQK